jgi:UDP-N-acetylmuramoyl-L-alanyl-D-glutamate--2,6-diaminopimelate ligase
MIKKIFQKLIPSFFMGWYHFLLAFFGAVIYGFPSKKMIAIGVIGTKGKTTTCNLIAQILNYCGYKTGMASTVNFRIGDKVWINETKQTMLGRFQLQKLLKRMADAGCKYAVVETSSEGILQHRHRFIDYDMAVFTNLSPEHIERHGSFEKYRSEKLKLFKMVAKKENGTGVYNLDDENVGHFLSVPVKNKWGYALKNNFQFSIFNFQSIFNVKNIQLSVNGSDFEINGTKFHTNLLGGFNVYNAAAAVCVALSQNIPIEKIREALKIAKPTPGRMEIIDGGQNFTAIIDYSYEPKGLESALKAIRVFDPKRIIVLIGSAGGGRDKWRRPVMGEIADKHADIVIITTDDPYDENPEKIIDEVLAGAISSQGGSASGGKNPARKINENIFRIIDRRAAIKKAIEIAQQGDAILFAGKGGERWMNLASGKKIPWDEAEIVKEEIKKFAAIE